MRKITCFSSTLSTVQLHPDSTVPRNQAHLSVTTRTRGSAPALAHPARPARPTTLTLSRRSLPQEASFYVPSIDSLIPSTTSTLLLPPLTPASRSFSPTRAGNAPCRRRHRRDPRPRPARLVASEEVPPRKRPTRPFASPSATHKLPRRLERPPLGWVPPPP